MDDQQLTEFLPVYVRVLIGDEGNPWTADLDSFTVRRGCISGLFGSKDSVAKHIKSNDYAGVVFINHFRKYLKDFMLAGGYALEDIEDWWLNLGQEEEQRRNTAYALRSRPVSAKVDKL